MSGEFADEVFDHVEGRLDEYEIDADVRVYENPDNDESLIVQCTTYAGDGMYGFKMGFDEEDSIAVVSMSLDPFINNLVEAILSNVTSAEPEEDE